MDNTILLRRKNKVIISRTKVRNEKLAQKYVNAIMVDIAQLGYTLSGDVMEKLYNLSVEEAKQFHSSTIDCLKKMVGAHVIYRPLFRNFPEDVPEDGKYLFDRIIGFLENVFGLIGEGYRVLSCGHAINTEVFDMSNFGACPICQYQIDEKDLDESKKRPPLKELTPFKVIELGSLEDKLRIFTNLVEGNSSTSQQDKDDIEAIFMEHVDIIGKYIPDSIPIKENMAHLVHLLVSLTDNYENYINSFAKTPTDILRIAAALSNGDLSLAAPTKFKSFSNRQRRMFLSMLDSMQYPQEDMLRWRGRWLRLGEKLHPGQYKNKFPNAVEAFEMLRNSEKDIMTFNSKVEALLTEENYEGAANVLANRPGEFARRLDVLLRKSPNTKGIIDKFKNSIVEKLPTPMLLTIASHIENRSSKSAVRYFLPKGSLAKIQLLEGDERKTIPVDVILEVFDTIEKTLVKRFSEKESMGKVYINPELRNYTLPIAQRTASSSLNIMTRGSRIELPDCEILRAFTYWKGSVDIDLSVVLYDENWGEINHISYTNLKGTGCVHSGDIQDAPNGAAEFIDMNITKLKEKGVRYAAMNVISFTGQPFAELDCFAGLMARQEAKSGEIFEPKTVKQRFDLTGESKYSIPAIIDIQESKMIWCDISLTTQPKFANVEKNASGIVKMGIAMSDMINTKPNLFHLLKLHAIGRAEVVHHKFDEETDYDFVFDIDRGIKPTDIDEIVANYL